MSLALPTYPLKDRALEGHASWRTSPGTQEVQGCALGADGTPSCDSLAVPLEAAPTEAGGRGEHGGEAELVVVRKSVGMPAPRHLPMTSPGSSLPTSSPSDLRNASCRQSLRLSSLGLAVDGQWCGNRRRSGFLASSPPGFAGSRPTR